jgi:hypothetical protein
MDPEVVSYALPMGYPNQRIFTINGNAKVRVSDHFSELNCPVPPQRPAGVNVTRCIARDIGLTADMAHRPKARAMAMSMAMAPPRA